jgi:hypothetical protein
MLKRLLNSSFSAALLRQIDSGIQVCPPLNRGAWPQARTGLQAWIASTLSPSLGGASARDGSTDASIEGPLASARSDFIAALADIRTQQAGELLRRIRLARSLRELWFLRTEVFNLVAHHRDQSEASHRMAMLGAHFPPQVRRASAARRNATSR